MANVVGSAETVILILLFYVYFEFFWFLIFIFSFKILFEFFWAEKKPAQANKDQPEGEELKPLNKKGLLVLFFIFVFFCFSFL